LNFSTAQLDTYVMRNLASLYTALFVYRTVYVDWMQFRYNHAEMCLVCKCTNKQTRTFGSRQLNFQLYAQKFREMFSSVWCS
jgi:hypothetical protein